MRTGPKIMSGKLKDKILKVPNSARPLTSRVKISMFDSLGDFTKDSNILDAFGGSGNFAIESLSRGARKVVIVEKDRDAYKVIKSNLNKLGLIKNQFEVWSLPYNRFAKIYNGEPFDLVFLDPPFKDEYFTIDFDSVYKLLKDHGVIILRLSSRTKFEIPEIFEEIKIKKIGVSTLYYFKKTKV